LRFGLPDHSSYLIVTSVDRANRNQTLLCFSPAYCHQRFSVIEFGLLIC